MNGDPTLERIAQGNGAGAVRGRLVDGPLCAGAGADGGRRRKARRQPAQHLHRRLAGLQTRHLRRLADRAAAPQPDPGRRRGQDRRALGQLFQPGRRGAPGEGRAGRRDQYGDDHGHAGTDRPQRGRRRRHLGRIDRHAGRGARRGRPRADPPPRLPPDLDRPSSGAGVLARGADRGADHVPDRLHHLAAGHLPFPQVRRRYFRGRHAGRAGAARDRRAAGGDHGGGPLGQRPTPPNSAR